jgi:hypothetical protein
MEDDVTEENGTPVVDKPAYNFPQSGADTEEVRERRHDPFDRGLLLSSHGYRSGGEIQILPNAKGIITETSLAEQTLIFPSAIPAGNSGFPSI